MRTPRVQLPSYGFKEKILLQKRQIPEINQSRSAIRNFDPCFYKFTATVTDPQSVKVSWLRRTWSFKT